MEKVNALIVFCEGPHDVAFCRLVFKHCFNIRKVEWKFSEYPAPLDKQFQTILQSHALMDLELDMAHKFFLPDKTLFDMNKKLLVLLFNTGGKTKTENPKKFLSDFIDFIEDTKTFLYGETNKRIDNYKFLFTYDADENKPSDIFMKCKKDYSIINNEDFISEDFMINPNYNHGAHSMDKKFNIYVFSKPDCLGTLEDILLPMFEECESKIMSKTTTFIDDCFKWEDSKISQIADRNKAIICIAGQNKKPGSSLNVIIDQTKLISEEVFKNNEDVKRFAEFIKEII